MKRTLIAMAIVMGCSAEASAQTATPFAGRWHWAGVETCAAKYIGDGVAIEIKAGKISFYESSCLVGKIQKLGEQSYRFDLVCRSEGETERSTTQFTLLAKTKIHDELLLRIESKAGFVMAYRRCP
jgi:hypothetical protein